MQVKRANDQMRLGVEKETFVVKLSSTRMQSFQDAAAVDGSYDELSRYFSCETSSDLQRIPFLGTSFVYTPSR